MDENEYPIVEHLRDMRKALSRALVGVVIGMIACFFYAEQILAWLREPMQQSLGAQSNFIVLVPHEYFFTQMKAALVAGIFLSSPWILYQVWLFVAPGLYKREKRLSALFVIASVFFFVSGAYFGYKVVFPPMFKFFLGTLPADVHGAYSVGMLFGFATNMLLAFGLVFETPVVVFILILMEIVDVQTLTKARRYVVVAAFVIAAILTPTPDPMTQCMMAVPMVLLFELGLLAARLFIRDRSGVNA